MTVIIIIIGYFIPEMCLEKATYNVTLIKDELGVLC